MLRRVKIELSRSWSTSSSSFELTFLEPPSPPFSSSLLPTSRPAQSLPDELTALPYRRAWENLPAPLELVSSNEKLLSFGSPLVPEKEKRTRSLLSPLSFLLPASSLYKKRHDSLVDISCCVHRNDLELEIWMKLLESIPHDVRLNESELGRPRTERERFPRGLAERNERENSPSQLRGL